LHLITHTHTPHTHTHTHTHKALGRAPLDVGLARCTDRHLSREWDACPRGIRTRSLSKRAAAYLLLRLRGRQHRLLCFCEAVFL